MSDNSEHDLLGQNVFYGFNLARDIVHRTAVKKGWWEPQVIGLDDETGAEVMAPRSFGELIALVHSEASEALEEHRNGHEATEVYHASMHTGVSPETGVQYGWKPEGIPIELADIIIRVLDIAGHYGIDIERAMMLKAKYNESREHRHGGKKL